MDSFTNSPSLLKSVLNHKLQCMGKARHMLDHYMEFIINFFVAWIGTLSSSSSLPSLPQASSEGIAVVLCVCVCPAFLFRMLLLSLRVLERLQTFSAVVKSCLLSIDIFFLLLETGKSLWCAEKYVSKCYVQIVQALGYLKVSNDRASQDL